MSNLLKSKILVGVFAFALMFVGAATINAATCDMGATTLRQGTRSEAVRCLQQTLNAKGFTVSTSGAGSMGMETTTFGPATRAAVMNFQSSANLVADGLVGAMTKGALNAAMPTPTNFPVGCSSTAGFSTTTGQPCSTTTNLPAGCTSTSGFSTTTGQSCSTTTSLPAGCTSTVGFSPTTGARCDSTTTTGPVTLTGGSGDAIVTSTQIDVETEVTEGTTEKVLGFRVEAEDSDIQLTNLRVSVINSSTSSNRRPDRYLSEVSVWMGNTKVGSIDPANMTRNGNDYSANITLSNAVVKRGLANRATFYIGFTALANIDSVDLQYASFNLDVSNVRFVDASGMVMTAVLPNNLNTIPQTGITFEDPSNSGDVRIRYSLGSTNPAERSVQVNEFTTTSNVDLLEFRVKAESMDMTIDSMTVRVDSTVSNLNTILTDLRIMQGSTTIADVSSFASNTTSTVTFNLYDDVVIDADETVTFKVVARLKAQDSNFTSGATLRAHGVSVSAEDRNGNNITNTIGSANGYAQTLFVNGANIVSVNSSSSATDQNNTSRDFVLVFDVTAIGNDVVVDRSVLSTSNTTGIQYAVVGGSITHTASLTSDASLSGSNYTVFEGQTRRFTLTVNMTTSSTGQKRFTLQKVANIAPSTTIESVTATVNQ